MSKQGIDGAELWSANSKPWVPSLTTQARYGGQLVVSALEIESRGFGSSCLACALQRPCLQKTTNK